MAAATITIGVRIYGKRMALLSACAAAMLGLSEDRALSVAMRCIAIRLTACGRSSWHLPGW